jgi:hypothetical protein
MHTDALTMKRGNIHLASGIQVTADQRAVDTFTDNERCVITCFCRLDISNQRANGSCAAGESCGLVEGVSALRASDIWLVVGGMGRHIDHALSDGFSVVLESTLVFVDYSLGCDVTPADGA